MHVTDLTPVARVVLKKDRVVDAYTRRVIFDRHLFLGTGEKVEQRCVSLSSALNFALGIPSSSLLGSGDFEERFDSEC